MKSRNKSTKTYPNHQTHHPPQFTSLKLNQYLYNQNYNQHLHKIKEQSQSELQYYDFTDQSISLSQLNNQYIDTNNKKLSISTQKNIHNIQSFPNSRKSSQYRYSSEKRNILKYKYGDYNLSQLRQYISKSNDSNDSQIQSKTTRNTKHVALDLMKMRTKIQKIHHTPSSMFLHVQGEKIKTKCSQNKEIQMQIQCQKIFKNRFHRLQKINSKIKNNKIHNLFRSRFLE